MKKLGAFWQKSDKFFLLPILFSVLSVFLITTFFGAVYQRLPATLPLFYSLAWGEKQLVVKQQFLLLPIIIILISLLNTLLTFYLHPGQIVLRRLLMVSLIVINLVILLTAFKILLIFI